MLFYHNHELFSPITMFAFSISHLFSEERSTLNDKNGYAGDVAPGYERNYLLSLTHSLEAKYSVREICIT